MLFQVFDSKKECAYIYAQEKLHFKNIPENLTKTWSYSEFLGDKNIEYAQLYCGNKTLDEACPEYLREEWNVVNKRLKAFFQSMKETNLDYSKYCMRDLVPNSFLEEYGEIKNKICLYVFKRYEKPDNYDYLLSLTKVTAEIKNKNLKINLDSLSKRMHEFKTRQFVKKIKKGPSNIAYDISGTKTGRLLTKKSFPILTMDKTYRTILEPNNDWFVEFDYNAAELRVLMGLLGKEQPQEDMHEWNLKNVFGGIGTRNKAKERIFAWLYNPKSKDYLSNRAYDRDSVLQKYYNGSQVTTFWNRKIDSDDHHALNYIIQSTAADLFLKQMVKVWNILKNKKSYIAFCVHDSFVVDFAEEDIGILREIKKIFKSTDLGEFKVNIVAGKNYGDMHKLSF